MANIQYNGARYVPKFFENPDDSSNDWKLGVSYEPLTVVTYHDDSYTSKIAVPASVGNPADNPTYWVKTGNFNASLTALQAAVSGINNTLDDLIQGNYLHNKKVVIYGDSTVQYNQSYINLACNAVGATCTNRAVGGTMMNTGTNNGVSLINASTDLATFDYIFLVYGTNEWQNSRNEQNLRSDVRLLLEAIWNKTTAIKIIFVTPFYSYRAFSVNDFEDCRNARGYSLEDVNNIIIRRLHDFSVAHINLFKRSSCNNHNYSSLLENNSGIYVHPLAPFKVELASIILDGPTTDKADVSMYPIIGNLDFVGGRSTITATVLNTIGLANEYCLYFNTAIKSVTKYLNINTRYLVVGECDNDFILSTASDSYTFTAGQFKAEINLSTGYTPITLTPVNGAQVTIKGFQIYAIYDNMLKGSDFARMGASFNATLNSSNISSVTAPKYSFEDDELILSTFSFKVANGSAVTSGELLYTLGNNVTIDQTFIPAFTNGGTFISLMVSGDKIYSATNFAASQYDYTFTCGRQRLTNQRYPNAIY